MCEYTNKAYEDAIVYLKTSPMFNLSLSSKELFHSNFLYWIYLYDKSYFKELVGKLGADTSSWGDDNDWVLKREYNNFDLGVIK